MLIRGSHLCIVFNENGKGSLIVKDYNHPQCHCINALFFVKATGNWYQGLSFIEPVMNPVAIPERFSTKALLFRGKTLQHEWNLRVSALFKTENVGN